MTPIQASRIKHRAAAMRMATLLSQVDARALSVSGWTKANGALKSRDVTVATPLAKWPEINMDYAANMAEKESIPYDDCRKGPSVWPIDCANALPRGERGVRMSYISTIKPADVRGAVNRIVPYMVRAESCDISTEGRITDFGSGFFGLIGGRWVTLNHTNARPGATTNDGGAFTEAPNLALGDSLVRRYEWSAVFSFPGGFRLRFGCSAQGALALFRDRERLDGEARRRALLHWVRRHWRRSSSVSEMREVRSHLRGVTTFEWNELPVSLVPAEYELETA